MDDAKIDAQARIAVNLNAHHRPLEVSVSVHQDIRSLPTKTWFSRSLDATEAPYSGVDLFLDASQLRTIVECILPHLPVASAVVDTVDGEEVSPF